MAPRTTRSPRRAATIPCMWWWGSTLVDPGNRMYLLDLWRGQSASDAWIEAWCDLVRKWKPMFWAEERGQIISGVGPFLGRRALERQAYVAREQFASRGDKAVR